MQRADAGKTAVRRNHGKGGVVPALEHEDAGVMFAQVAAFVGFGMNLVKHRRARCAAIWLSVSRNLAG